MIAIGQVIDGRYRIVRRLGGGGMGTVYAAEQLNIQRTVAVKVIRDQPGAEAEDISRFEAEALIISNLRHPNTLKLFDYGRMPDGTIYFVTELLTGRPLSQAIAGGPFAPLRVLHILEEVLRSLEEAHAQQIIHRDLKPSNIFLDRVAGREVVKVLDFGIAKIGEEASLAQRLSPGHEATAEDTILGTPAYMSPEQSSGQRAEPRSDLYSLGVLAYECLTGQPPFTGDPRVLMVKHARDLPPPFAAGLEIDARVEALVRRLLAKDPEDRPPSARALLEEVQQLARALESKPAPKRSAAWLLVPAALIGVFAISVWFGFRSRPSPAEVPPDASMRTTTATTAERDAGTPPRPPPEKRVSNARVIAGWKDEHVRRELVTDISRLLERCATKSQKLSVRIAVQGTTRSVSVLPENQTFRACLERALLSASWPPPDERVGLIGADVGR